MGKTSFRFKHETPGINSLGFVVYTIKAGYGSLFTNFVSLEF
jgi:hypothetical protein